MDDDPTQSAAQSDMQRIRAAVEEWHEAEQHVRDAVLAALRDGATSTEVAAVSGLWGEPHEWASGDPVSPASEPGDDELAALRHRKAMTWQEKLVCHQADGHARRPPD